MRIGIDARMYGPQSRGLGRYVQKLVDNLVEIDNVNEYFIILSPENWDQFNVSKKNFVKVLLRAHWYSFAEQIFLPIKLWRLKLDIMHFPHFNVPILYRRKFIVTIHDLIVSHYPDSRATTLPRWMYNLKLMAYKLVVGHAIVNSHKILAVSQFTKQDIERYYPRVADKIEVTYEGFSVDHGHSQLIDLEKEHNITKPYILHVGAAYPHKNLYRLLQAWKLCQTTLGNQYQLVIAGRKDYFMDRLEKEAKDVHLDVDVLFLGFVPDEHLASLYQFSLAYIFPSFIEGFGLPAIEAQSYGVPVLASNNSSLPEILGNSALYFDPFSINDISKTINKILNNIELKDKIRNLGYKNYIRFDWQGMAKQVKRTYEHLGK
jgi:glycosyltransferase involved in cell wall biosynthesis